jgi:catechol 2,3-dioxygenase-like lactoylglutathione lyase family enzyme
MSSPRASHVAITVPDLEHAEAYYQALFDMEVVTREELGPDGDRQLPRDKDWSDARRAGIDLYMVALRREGFVLALFDEASPFIGELGLRPYRPLFIGLDMPADEIARVRARLPGEDWDEESGGFRDRYGVGWQFGNGTFSGTGDRIGRWLKI